jgi:phosphate transport system ATP-binding protein
LPSSSTGSDATFFDLAGAGKPGRLVEMKPTGKIFSNPDDPSTEAYVSGRFG